MKHLILLIFLITQTSMTLFNFDSKSDISNWRIVDDVVMGGRSNGNFKINDSGNGIFRISSASGINPKPRPGSLRMEARRNERPFYPESP